MPGWEVISWVLVIALPISLPAAALTMPADLGQIALKPWLALLYVALFSQWIGFFAWNAGMAMGGIARVSQVQLLQPFVTFALAALFNGETITPQILLFAAAVVATVAISTRTGRGRARRLTAVEAVIGRRVDRVARQRHAAGDADAQHIDPALVEIEQMRIEQRGEDILHHHQIARSSSPRPSPRNSSRCASHIA